MVNATKESSLIITLSAEFKKTLAHFITRINDTEWGGVVFYSMRGSFLDDKIQITLKNICLLDIGSAAATEHKYDEDPRFIEACMDNLGEPYGLIHSHAKMGVFYSGTDEKEILTNLSAYPKGYLSVVVNSFGDILARFTDEYTITTKEIVHSKDNRSARVFEYEDKKILYTEDSMNLFRTKNPFLDKVIEDLKERNKTKAAEAKKKSTPNFNKADRFWNNKKKVWEQMDEMEMMTDISDEIYNDFAKNAASGKISRSIIPY